MMYLMIQNNRLSVELKAFNHALKIFKVGVERKNAKKPPVILPAILSFNNGFLSIECDDKVAVMNATGEWHGKVQFSHSIVKALALVPISVNPVIITYVDASRSTSCRGVRSRRPASRYSPWETCHRHAASDCVSSQPGD